MMNAITDKASQTLLNFKDFGKELVNSPTAMIRGIGSYVGMHVPLYAMAHDNLGPNSGIENHLFYSAIALYSIGFGCSASWWHLNLHDQDEKQNYFDKARKYVGTGLSVTAGICSSMLLYDVMQPYDSEVTNSVLKMIQDNADILAFTGMLTSIGQLLPEMALAGLANRYREKHIKTIGQPN